MTAAIANNVATFHVEASALLDAPPKAVYAIIADYRVNHPVILPKPYFTSLTVEHGGVGAGTIVHVHMKVWGKSFEFRQIVSEPEPGRILAETDMETGQYTQFIFEPVDGGQKTHLTIASEFPVKPGIMGWIEKMTQPSVIRRMYEQELRNIADYLQRQ